MLDKDNLEWFPQDRSKDTPSEIRLQYGKLCRLKPFDLRSTYPILVIAGQNGSGKSTILAITACAFHNLKAILHSINSVFKSYGANCTKDASFGMGSQRRYSTPPFRCLFKIIRQLRSGYISKTSRPNHMDARLKRKKQSHVTCAFRLSFPLSRLCQNVIASRVNDYT